MKIAISSGHGKHVSGAVGIINEVTEARRVVSCVVSHLKELGVDVAEFHDDTSRNQMNNISTIVSWHNAQNADLNISVHFNAFQPTEGVRGVEVLHRTKVEMAAKVSQAISDISGLRNRGAKIRYDLGFLNFVRNAPILVEVCFVDAQADVDIYRDKYDEICKAIAEIISGKKLANVEQDIDSSFRVSDENLRTMQDLNIIRSPEFWAQIDNIKYLDALFSNVVRDGVCDKRIDNDITDIDIAFEVLMDAGIINTPEYWRNLIKAGTSYMNDLLIAISNRCRIVLEKIVHAEAQGEDMKGQELVANVVLNRHENKAFPNGIHNVVCERNINIQGILTYQFTPISDGSFNRAIPSDSVKQAVSNILNGSDHSNGALFFCTVASFSRPDSWHANNLQVLFRHGNHVFFR